MKTVLFYQASKITNDSINYHHHYNWCKLKENINDIMELFCYRYPNYKCQASIFYCRNLQNTTFEVRIEKIIRQ